LVLSGGEQDISLENRRSQMEYELLSFSIQKKKPILGICRGMQWLHIFFASKKEDDIKESSFSERMQAEHMHYIKDDPYRRFETLMHTVDVKKGTKLYDITKQDVIATNSSHNFKIIESTVSKKVSISGRAPDGVIEAIEVPSYENFLLGVEWHPEFLLTADDEKIIKAFCNSVSNTK